MLTRLGIVVFLTCTIFVCGCSQDNNRGWQGSMISAAELSGLNLSGQVVNGVRVIKMTAQRFVYDPNTIVVKKDEPVRLEITSMDVTHGFAIEAFNIDRKLKPHETEIIEFTPRQTGKFEFYCTVYCGKGHANMRGYMYVKD